MKRSLLLFLCLCMFMSGTAYAQDGNEDGQSAETTEGQEKAEEEKPEASVAEKSEESIVEETKEIRGIAAEEEGTETAEDTQPRAVAAGNVAINEANFPDPVFRNYIIENFDLDGSGSLSEDEISAVEKIDYGNIYGDKERLLSDLTGIQYFTNLKILQCEYNQLKNLDVSSNVALETLTCENNQLENLDVSKNVVLETLTCRNNRLENLDVSKSAALRMLDCGDNQLTSLGVSSNVALESLVCGGNQLTSLDVSNNVALGSLACGGNQLTSLDVSNNVALESLVCRGNQLTSLDVSNNVALRMLDCSGNQLTSLDAGGDHPSLNSLFCNPTLKENINLNWNSNVLSFLLYGGKPVYMTAYLQDGAWKVDLSAIVLPEDYVFGLEPSDGGGFDLTTGIWDLGTEQLEWKRYTLQRKGTKIWEKMVVPVHVDYGEPGETVKVEAEGTNVKVDASKVDTVGIYEMFGIGPGDTNVEIKVEQKEAAVGSKERMEEILKQSGDTSLSVYEVVMSLYADGESKGTVTDGFGSLTLSFYAGKEHAGKKAVVYQLHGNDEVLTYKDLVIDGEGMVTISVSQLSSFAVALQNNAGTGAGDSGTGDGSGTDSSQPGGNGSGTDGNQSGAGGGADINTGQPVVDRTSAAGAQGASPKTGDFVHMALWIAAMLFSGSITAFAISRKQQR